MSQLLKPLRNFVLLIMFVCVCVAFRTKNDNISKHPHHPIPKGKQETRAHGIAAASRQLSVPVSGFVFFPLVYTDHKSNQSTAGILHQEREQGVPLPESSVSLPPGAGGARSDGLPPEAKPPGHHVPGHQRHDRESDRTAQSGMSARSSLASNTH